MPGLDQAVKDPDFLKASVPDQMAYLAHVDPDFKSASSEDKLAYLNHITGKQAPTTASNAAENASAKEGGWGEFGKGILKAPLQAVDTTAQLINKIPKIGETLAPEQGVTALHKIAAPSNESQEIGSTAANRLATWVPVGAEAGAAGVAGKLVPFAKRAATSLVGGAMGAEAGKYGGRLIGIPEIGEAVGGLAGGLAGGGAFGEGPRKIGNPSELPVVGKYLPDLLAEAPKKIPTVEPISSAPFELTSPPAERETPIQDTLHFPKPAEPPVIGPLEPPQPKASMSKLEDLIAHEGAGMPRLDPNTPIGQQARSVGAAAMTPPQIPPRAGVIPNVPLGSRVATPVSEEFGPMMKRPEEMPRILTEEPARQMGGGPLRPGISLRDQPKTMEAPVRSEQARIEEKYPDKADRQMVHANGEEMVDAIGHDPDTMKAVHDLTNPDVRQAMINSGEDMGQMMINNRKASGDMSRQDAFRKLLGKGLTPQKIVELARQPIEHAAAK